MKRKLWFFLPATSQNAVSSWLNVSLRCLLAGAALAGCYYSALLATAAYLFDRNTAASTGLAAHLVPYNSRYIARLADWEPEHRASLLQRATELNRFDSASWIQLGLLTELDRHDPQGAEHYYLKAAAVDHMFQPKWTLTNFYFRRQNKDQFFRWARATLAITPYAPDPVFTQMWLMTQDAKQIEAAIPERVRTLLQYAGFLASSKRFLSIPSIVQRLVDAVPARDAHAWGRDDMLAEIEDRLLAGSRRDAALMVWASMRHAGWIPGTIPTPDHPLTNGEFALPFYGHGFDWVVPTPAGVAIDQLRDKKSLRMTFSGDQAEHCDLLRQYIPVEPGREYEMRWLATGLQMNAPSGLAWRVQPVPESNTSVPSLFSADLLDRTATVWRFRVPAATNLCTLTLEYARPRGAVRARGVVRLEAISLTGQS